ncbi:hypothetical protein EYF80_005685 [Liparis tanakae]|uniref:Uncharacterized protein n=1 Tax=Liparis tanakae TaxID=230148 RepID=A0A4Z2J1H5_9TELE|nr:hypothetical protein EYF80_005685 [Liparis tanakae]
MLGVLEVKGEATEASSSDREMPPCALFRAWARKVIFAACPSWGEKASAMMTVSWGGIIPQSRATEMAQYLKVCSDYIKSKNSSNKTTSTRLVKADQIDLTADIDSLWTDAENTKAFEASLGIHNASSHGGWQRRWHSDCDDVQGLNDDGLSWHLEQIERKVPLTSTASHGMMVPLLGMTITSPGTRSVDNISSISARKGGAKDEWRWREYPPLAVEELCELSFGPTGTVLQVEGRAADLQIIQAAVGGILVKGILRPVLLARFIIAALVATYRGAHQYHFGVTRCGTGAHGFDAPLRHPVEQQEEEAPRTQHPEAHEGHPPTTQTVALQLLKDKN